MPLTVAPVSSNTTLATSSTASRSRFDRFTTVDLTVSSVPFSAAAGETNYSNVDAPVFSRFGGQLNVNQAGNLALAGEEDMPQIERDYLDALATVARAGGLTFVKH